MIAVEVITKEHDLRQLVDEINLASWDDANEMSEYDAEALLDYLDHEGTVFIACHDVVEGVRSLMGIASSRLEVKPYAKECWLYVDEVDVCANRRRKGAGQAIMKKLIEVAEEAECVEVWLGAEVNNEAANELYRSIDPDEVVQVLGYTYETQD
ncbi:MAG: GNAT family N-acetyltransferase [Pseudomonadales bacterium]